MEVVLPSSFSLSFTQVYRQPREAVELECGSLHHERKTEKEIQRGRERE